MVNFNKTIIFQGLRGSNTFQALGFYFFQGVGPTAYLDLVIFQGGLSGPTAPLWIRACAEYHGLSFTSMVKRLCMLALASADFLIYMLLISKSHRLICFCYNEVDFGYP